ncbi:hypothetical protein JQ554_27370 [Bradyrhizobium diazoefficiens]|nr:hypothetical protein [Bradyrhizobium diazoefficiens]UCF53899.1 MAG: hypothetical protein JSV48_05925 [Bradyrhizobium sp.]MBR0967957.1 hypothetical protein [Bradyrhizobium diazoefficiens]MBR0981354.1 hypothetical protein [Bradyrhizobium diazoefficiens]MBR1010808.1 hypothetical protein [Bradyrhizobium diazoefficiens]MBR1018213.1 hypothetical protein [Bradyrhizobium diazoefficiens]
MLQSATRKDETLLGIGFYTVPEAARLLKIAPLNIRRWLGGYRFTQGDKTFDMPPLWKPQLPSYDHHMELGFRDLIELRVIKSFLDAGLSILTVRNCLDYARGMAGDDHPFSTRRFLTDGRTIFLESLRRTGEDEVLDLKSHQYVIKKVIDRTFKDLDISHDIVSRWRPLEGKQSIVIDPTRAFGQPITNNYGVPTIVLADAVKAEGSVERVSKLYDVSPSAIRDAVKFEKSLAA